MKTWSFYDSATGAISPRRFTSSDPEVIRLNTPEGLRPMEGVFACLSQRVEFKDGEPVIVDYQPPQPSADHEWNAESRRWVKRADVIARETRAAQARARIDALERKQLRALRELFIDPNNAEARVRLQAIDDEIAGLRRDLLPVVK